MEEYKKVLQKIEDIDNDDDNLEMLEKAVECYCGMYDKCEGLKHALRLTLGDQYQNHFEEQAEDDLEELNKILNVCPNCGQPLVYRMFEHGDRDLVERETCLSCG